MEYLSSVFEFLVLIPAAILCYLPMRNQMLYSPLRTAALGGIAFLIFIPAAAGFICFFQVSSNVLLLPVLALFFFFYQKTLAVSLPKAFAVYILNYTLLSFCSVFSYGFDAWLHPHSTYQFFSWEAGCFQLCISFVLLLFLAFPFSRQFRYIIDHLDIDKLWYITLPVSGIFLIFNLLFIPRSYKTLHINRVFPIFLFVAGMLFVLFAFLCVLFYYTVTLLMNHAKQEERTHFLEIQAEQYTILYNHMEQTRRLRHDFKHSVHVLSVLASNGDIESLKKHLSDYEQEQAMILDRIRPFCKNATLNALFNHYFAMAQSACIRTDWQITLPDPPAIPELDLANLLGNILENAIAGCQTVPKAQRYFSLSIETLEKDSLYIVSSNSSDGNLKKKSGIYQTTKGRGHGLGLYSIRTLAEKYHGMAQFSYVNGEFCVDVVLKL